MAQRLLNDAGEDLASDFDRFVDRTIAAVHEPDSRHAPESLVELARPMLAGLLSELEQAAQQDLTDFEHLHQVRILDKRLRYAMEVFVGCFPPLFKETLYPEVEDMQEILGRANDSRVASARLIELRNLVRAGWPTEWKRIQSGFNGLLRFHQRRVPVERRRFVAWWHHWCQSQARTFFDMLAKAP
jgi:CHAD domain-containing protein